MLMIKQHWFQVRSVATRYTIICYQQSCSTLHDFIQTNERLVDYVLNIEGNG